MADWQRTLRLNPEWQRAQDGDLSIQYLASTTARRLKSLSPFGDDAIDDERDELVWQFEQIAADQDASTSDFDAVMGDLYDWADTRLDEKWAGKRVCWVDTIAD